MHLPAHLLDLTWLFFRASFSAFGGGISAIPLMQHEAVTQHHWLTEQQFADSYALGQFTPGPGMLMVMAVGYHVSGVAGALAAMLAMFVPAGVLTWVTGWYWQRHHDAHWRDLLQKALTPVTVGLLISGGLTLVHTAVHDAATAAIMLIAGALLLSKRFNPALIVVFGGLAGVIYYR